MTSAGFIRERSNMASQTGDKDRDEMLLGGFLILFVILVVLLTLAGGLPH